MIESTEETKRRLQELADSLKNAGASADDAKGTIQRLKDLMGAAKPRELSEGERHIKEALEAKEREKIKAAYDFMDELEKNSRRITDGVSTASPVLLDELVNLKYMTRKNSEFHLPFGFWMIGPGIPDAQIIRYARNEEEAIMLTAAQWYRAKEKNLDICFNRPVGRVLKALEKIRPPGDLPTTPPDYEQGGNF